MNPRKPNVFIYECGGKSQVYATRELVFKKSKKTRALYFVDKDWSDLLGEHYPDGSDIFVTEYYSIENYLVTSSIFRRICEELLHLSPVEVVDQLEISFQSGLEEFHEQFTPITSQIITLRKAGDKPNYRNINLDNLFKLDEELKPTTTEEIEPHILRVCNVKGKADRATLTEVTRMLIGTNPKIHLRGKFELWYLVKCVRSISNGLKVRTKSHLSLENCIEIIGPRVPMFDSIRIFTNRNFSRFWRLFSLFYSLNKRIRKLSNLN